MRRIIPTAVVGFGTVMLMLRAFSIQSDRAAAAVGNNTSRVDAIDGVFRGLGEAGGAALPPAFLVAGLAFVLALGYAVVG